jgi:3-isopropylmalate dehydrogenase
MSEAITVLPGDGIGPEVVESTLRVLDEVGDFEYRYGLIGGAAMDEYDGDPLPRDTVDLVRDSRAVLLGAVGGPKWESTDPDAPRPEEGLLRLRGTMGTHANLRPAFAIPSLKDLSPFRPERIEGTNLLIVRELLAGSYFGDKGREGDRAHDDREYFAGQIQAIARTAFDEARTRSAQTGSSPHVTSVDKANVLETSRLWRETVTALHAEEYTDVELDHMYVDNAAFQIGSKPRHFEVILTENEYGDILSDEAALFTGSLGLMPSACVDRDGWGYWEPVHGSAPDKAGKGIANPTAMLWSACMMLDKLGMEREADSIRWSIDGAFKRRVLTPDLGGEATTQEFIDRIIRDIPGFHGRQ